MRQLGDPNRGRTCGVPGHPAVSHLCREMGVPLPPALTLPRENLTLWPDPPEPTDGDGRRNRTESWTPSRRSVVTMVAVLVLLIIGGLGQVVSAVASVAGCG